MAYVSVDDLMLYCRADDDADGQTRQLIASLGEEAEAYLAENGADPDSMTGNDLQVFAGTVKAMTLHRYDHPAGEEYPPGLQRWINKVKYTKRETEE